MEGSRLTPEIICYGLRIIQAGYERHGEDFNIVFAKEEYGKGQHRIEVSFCRLLSEAVELLNQYQTRTLTEQEMDDQIDAYDGSAVFFIEEKRFGKLYPVYLCRNNPVRNDPNFFALNLECYFVRSEIDKSWRCWNKKPTKEQRERTPWKE